MSTNSGKLIFVVCATQDIFMQYKQKLLTEKEEDIRDVRRVTDKQSIIGHRAPEVHYVGPLNSMREQMLEVSQLCLTRPGYVGKRVESF